MLEAVKRGCAGVAAMALFGMAGVAGAQTAAPTAVDVLFERKHLDGLAKGAALTYRFERTVSDAKTQGEGFGDDIQVDVNDVSEQGKDVAVQIFTGERARERQVIPGMTGNPLLVVFLDRCVINMSRLTGAQAPYLKGAFRNALRDKAKIEPARIDYAGKTVDGYKVTIEPYADDPNATKLQGYERSRFTITVSEQVPGHFVSMLSHFENIKPETPGLEERITIAKVDGAQVAVTSAPQAGTTGDAK